MKKIALLALIMLFAMACKKEKQQCYVKISRFVNDVAVSDSTMVYPYTACMDDQSGTVVSTVDKDGVISTEVSCTYCK